MYLILALLGIIIAPVFTLGCVLLHYNHPALGTVAIILSILEFHTYKYKKK